MVFSKPFEIAFVFIDIVTILSINEFKVHPGLLKSSKDLMAEVKEERNIKRRTYV